MKLGGIVTFTLRESRGARARLAFFTACVAIGVAAVVGVAGLAGAIDSGLRAQSRELLAADVAIQSRRPLPEGLDAIVESVVPDAIRTDVRELATMAGAVDDSGAIDRSRLCELKVVAGDYPFYGELELEPAGRLAELLDANSVVVAPEVLPALGLAVGETIRVGGADFRIAGLVRDEPDKLDFALTLGPRIFVSADGFDRTSLLGVGNRVKYRALLGIPGNRTRDQLEAICTAIEDELEGQDAPRVRSHFDAQPGVRRGLDRFASFLGLVALLSLILGGIGVAEVVRSWLAARVIDVAVWKSIGLRPGEILWLHLAHALLFALIGSVVGAVLGGSVPFLVPYVVPDLISADKIDAFQPAALARGILLGVGVAGLFALTALTALWRVPPALVLRAGAQPLAAPRLVRFLAFAAVAVGLFAGAWIQGGRADLAAWFSGGIGVLGLVLWLGARALVWTASVIPRKRLGPYVAHGLSALSRPGAGTIGAIVALGLGTLVVVTLVLVQTRLESELAGALPGDAPSVFLVDVQPDQWDGVEAALEGVNAERIDAVPVVMARIAAIDGVPVADLIEENERGSEADGPEGDGNRRARWTLTREQRLTWLDELPSSNKLVAGELWSDPERAEVSLEQEYAESLGARVGTTLVFDVQGVPFELLVTSLRTVEWESFQINFFLIVEPGVLDDAPHMRLAAARIDASQEDRLQNELVAGFPNVTMLRIRPILEKVTALLSRIAFGVRFLGAFTLVAGLAILGGSVGASQSRRGGEVALFKTFGVTRRGILGVFATEFALSGAVAGVLGGLGAYALAWGFLTHAVEIDAELALGRLFLGVGATVLLTVVAGIAASARALRARPIETLRG